MFPGSGITDNLAYKAEKLGIPGRARLGAGRLMAFKRPIFQTKHAFGVAHLEHRPVSSSRHDYRSPRSYGAPIGTEAMPRSDGLGMSAAAR